jgi:hypothetical protein
MKGILFLLLLLPALLFSCKSLPEIGPAGTLKPGFPDPFIRGKYRLSHSIKAELPNGNEALLIGLTIADGTERAFDAVIMTVEGLVLFEAGYADGALHVDRCIPPFDSPAFANGLTDDLNLLYFMPDCAHAVGSLEGRHTMRYKCADTTIDVIEEMNGSMKINKYDSNNLIRSINILSFNKEGIPDKLELTAHGFFGYSLYLELIGFEQIQ